MTTRYYGFAESQKGPPSESTARRPTLLVTPGFQCPRRRILLRRSPGAESPAPRRVGLMERSPKPGNALYSAILNELYDFGSQGCTFEPCRVQLAVPQGVTKEIRRYIVVQFLSCILIPSSFLVCRMAQEIHVASSLDTVVTPGIARGSMPLERKASFASQDIGRCSARSARTVPPRDRRH
jgi:hypothetical protein